MYFVGVFQYMKERFNNYITMESELKFEDKSHILKLIFYLLV